MFKVIIDGKTFSAFDGQRLSDFLVDAEVSVPHPCGGRGVCQKCAVEVNGQTELSCRYEIHSDITVRIPRHTEIASDTGAVETGVSTEDVCFALDIGTTTLALALVSLDKGEIVKVLTRTNPQTAFGADVMSRIDYCSKNGVGKLQKAVTERISQMVAQFALPSPVRMFVAGNATMLHLFFGVDASSMGRAPYTPAFLDSKTCKGEELGIAGVSEIISLPSISAFVGADLVAGLNFVGMPQEGKYNLLIDLGTNAEIVLYARDNALCTAAAAGPCFEGANISCGMSAEDGAIWAYKNGACQTIGNAPARGICGTGLIDIVSELLRQEIIEESGYMEEDRFDLGENVYLCQADVRQFQVAKSAVCSAVLTLMENQGIGFESVEKVYLSGGFSGKINIQNAVKVGLLPAQLFEKCVAVKNSSLLGTVKFAWENNDLSDYLKTKYVDLSADPNFSDRFIENMLFE